MPFVACSVHEKRDAKKYASVYAAWFRADGVRTAWRQKLCPPALREELAQVLSGAQTDSLDVTVCPACGSDSSEDLDPIYLNIYLPKQAGMEYQLPTCTSCAANLRVLLQRGATKLPDRYEGETSSDADDTDWGLP